MNTKFKDPADEWMDSLSSKEREFFQFVSLSEITLPLVETKKLSHEVFWVRGIDSWVSQLNKTTTKLGELSSCVTEFGKLAKDPYLRLDQVPNVCEKIRQTIGQINCQNNEDGVSVTLLSSYGVEWCNKLFKLTTQTDDVIEKMEI